ncbi:MAG: extracellular solute-binding protein, partial [Bacillota bacterium]|nr:extracellular solute-binding protein [Bacillota bacterium]
MKKIICILTTVALSVSLLYACGANKSAGNADKTKKGNGLGEITVVSREDGSGTRGSFVELMKITDDRGNDATYDGAEITNSTSVMLTTVSGNKNAVGYVSLGSLSSDVKAVFVDGAEATTENVKSGKYKISRPFNVCYKDGSLSALAQDFLNFIISDEGQKIIDKEGYISVEAGKSYKASGLKGKISLAGSTSVSPVMEVLADEYKKLNPNVTIEIQQNGSSAGISSAIEGVCDLGMSSR